MRILQSVEISWPNSAPITPNKTTAVVCFRFSSAKLDGLRTISSSSSSKSSGYKKIEISSAQSYRLLYESGYSHLVPVLVAFAFRKCFVVKRFAVAVERLVRCAYTEVRIVPSFRPAVYGLFCPFDPIHLIESVVQPHEFQYSDAANVLPSFQLVAV